MTSSGRARRRDEDISGFAGLDPGKEFKALKADIEKHGVLVPVEYDEEGNILDGYHRVKACEELSIQEWPKVVRSGLTEEQKRSHARRLNLLRRHLSQEQKRELTRSIDSSPLIVSMVIFPLCMETLVRLGPSFRPIFRMRLYGSLFDI